MSQSKPSLQLDLMAYRDRLRKRQVDGKVYLFGFARRRWLVLQPEEVVRQLLLYYLHECADVPTGRMAVEKLIRLGRLRKRFDLVVYNKAGEPILLVECKAPGQKLNLAVLEQVSLYNQALNIPYLLVTNGQDSYLWEVDEKAGDYRWLDTLPIL